MIWLFILDKMVADKTLNVYMTEHYRRNLMVVILGHGVIIFSARGEPQALNIMAH